ncbi:hypothetical protein [Thermoflavifilum thermophilum]|uniref:hypothetical protein n=1 Tax=Thermoflavifilum thermophilum TaxID=1393122 RepID=UPI000B87354D|nr:hypothetical protein [Thermoflavifilum thermophilum]
MHFFRHSEHQRGLPAGRQESAESYARCSGDPSLRSGWGRVEVSVIPIRRWAERPACRQAGIP